RPRDDRGSDDATWRLPKHHQTRSSGIVRPRTKQCGKTWDSLNYAPRTFTESGDHTNHIASADNGWRKTGLGYRRAVRSVPSVARVTSSPAIRRLSWRPSNQANTAMTKQAPTTAAKANRTLSTKPSEFGVAFPF